MRLEVGEEQVGRELAEAGGGMYAACRSVVGQSWTAVLLGGVCLCRCWVAMAAEVSAGRLRPALSSEPWAQSLSLQSGNPELQHPSGQSYLILATLMDKPAPAPPPRIGIPKIR